MTYAEWRTATTLPRLMSKVQKREDGCWIWTGFITPAGYGACGYRGNRNTLAHRATYLELVGPIPRGLTLDHLCHTRDDSCPGGATCPHRRCVNPAHMEPVTNAENNSRGVFAKKTHCPKGHSYSGGNLGRTKQGGRFCRECSRVRSRERKRLESQGPIPRTRVILNPRPRLTHCHRDHLFDEANTYVLASGQRRCRRCACERQRGYSKAKRAEAEALLARPDDVTVEWPMRSLPVVEPARAVA